MKTTKKYWVLQAKQKPYDICTAVMFFTGNTYQFQGDRYAVVDVNIEQAKQYTSKARAINAANNYDFEHYSFMVKPLE